MAVTVLWYRCVSIASLWLYGILCLMRDVYELSRLLLCARAAVGMAFRDRVLLLKPCSSLSSRVASRSSVNCYWCIGLLRHTQSFHSQM